MFKDICFQKRNIIKNIIRQTPKTLLDQHRDYFIEPSLCSCSEDICSVVKLIHSLNDTSNFNYYYGNEYLYKEFVLKCIDDFNFLCSEEEILFLEYIQIKTLLPKYFIFDDSITYDNSLFELIMSSYYTPTEWKEIINNFANKDDNNTYDDNINDNLILLSKNCSKEIALKIYFIFQTQILVYIKQNAKQSNRNCIKSY